MQQPEKFDGADLDAILELQASPGYRLAIKRLEAELERRRVHLEQDCDLPLTAYTRGYIAALRLWLQIAAILTQEIKAQL